MYERQESRTVQEGDWLVVRVRPDHPAPEWWEMFAHRWPLVADQLARDQVAVVRLSVLTRLSALPGWTDPARPGAHPLIDEGALAAHPDPLILSRGRVWATLM